MFEWIQNHAVLCVVMYFVIAIAIFFIILWAYPKEEEDNYYCLPTDDISYTAIAMLWMITVPVFLVYTIGCEVAKFESYVSNKFIEIKHNKNNRYLE